MALIKPIYFQATMLVWRLLYLQHHHDHQTQLTARTAMKAKA
jgi:hypothetical protein